MPSPRSSLPRSAVRRSLGLAVPEGMLYAGMVGCAETWFVVDAIRLGASPFEQALVVGLPLGVGALGSLAALRLMRHVPSRRALVASFTALQALALLALALLDAIGRQTPALLVAGASLYHVAGQGASPGWTSWYGDLVPERIRGNYFARRMKAVQATICASMVVAGFALQLLEPRLIFGAATTAWWPALAAPGRGFALIFLLAGLSRLASTLLLLRSPEPSFQGLAPAARVVQFLRTSRGSTAWRLIVGSAGYYAVVYLASPFFLPFMAHELHFSYLMLMGAFALQIALKSVLQVRFGEWIDRHGARAVWLLGVLGCALVPLPYLWAGGWPWVYASQFAAGITWGCLEIALFVLVLHTTFRATRPHAIAAQSSLNGIAQLLGSVAGGLFLSLDGATFRRLFAISIVARCLFVLLLPRLVRPRPGGGDTGAKALLLRVVGVVPSGGLAHEVDLPEERPRRDGDR